MDPAIIDQPALRAACVRHSGPYMQIGQAFGRLTQALSGAGVASGAPLIGVYYDNPATTPENQLQSDAGVLLPPDVRVPATLAEVTLAAGKYACLRHLGPYNTLAVSWGRLREWIPAQALRRGKGPGYEIYRNTPMDTPPSDLITEIYVPLDSP